MLARRWRPTAFEAVVGQEGVCRTLQHSLRTNRYHQAYLFTGTRGVGKTTLARLLARCYVCEQGVSAQPCGHCATCESVMAGRHLDVIEMDAASHTKVEDIRALLEQMHYPPVSARYKIYLLDEVHMLSQHSFNALLKTLEEPPESVIFMLATTDPHKIPATLRSRCLRLALKSVSMPVLKEYLERVTQAEGIVCDAGSLTLLAQAGNGSVRDALTCLEGAIHAMPEGLTVSGMQALLGYVPETWLEAVLDAIATRNIEAVPGLMDIAERENFDSERVLEQAAQQFYEAAWNSSTEQRASAIDAVTAQWCYEITWKACQELSVMSDPLLVLKMWLLRAISFRPWQITDSSLSHKKEERVGGTVAKKPTREVAQKPARSSQSSPRVLNASGFTESIRALSLNGLVRILADHLRFVAFEAPRLTVALAAEHRAFYQPQRLLTIQESLSAYWQEPIQCILSDHETETHQSAAEILQQERLQQRQAIEKDLHQHPQWQAVKNTFQAELDHIEWIEPSS